MVACAQSFMTSSSAKKSFEMTSRNPLVFVTLENAISVLRGSETPKIDALYINDIFGQGMNGIRERAWLRFISGHLNIETLRLARTCVVIDGKDTKINIFEMKVTPSMKNVVYSVYVVFTSEGIYVGKLSKCDCPNGWLFCSHTLATFLLIYSIQMKKIGL